jgi:predicted SprT family Zn-dependent metalloprotease
MATWSQAAASWRRMSAEHGITGWRFQPDNARRRAGNTNYTRRTVSLSRHFVARNSLAQVEDTLLHEIAHVLVGPGHGHDRVWQAKHRAIGGDGIRCYDAAEVDMPTPAWVGVCQTNAAHTWARHRLTQKARNGRCPTCYRGGRSPDSGRISWTTAR